MLFTSNFVFNNLTYHVYQVVFTFSGELQPLDVTVNDCYKKRLKEKFIEWYSAEVSELGDDELSSVMDLRTSLVKPLHAEWLIRTDKEVTEETIVSGFQKTGILACLGDDGDETTTASPPISP